MIIGNTGDEQQVVKSVVNRVLKEMDTVCLEVAKYPVGLDEVVQDFEKTAIQSAPQNVQIVGIWGMGGMGKTTLAKEFYNRRCSGMDYASFLSDVRHAAESGELPMKQKKLLKDLDLDLDLRDVPLDNIAEGKQIVKKRWRSNQLDAEKSALIILDDVDHPDQLEALLPPRESFGHRNLIIITTRELDVLNAWGISTVFKMRPLNETHAEQLFCWHAFLKQSPRSGFEDLVKKFIKACDGLPLSLKVLGGQLYGKSNKGYWQRTLNKFSRILPKDIKQRLKVSYDALDEEEKQMFLDAACFFIGRRFSTAIEVWDGSEWDGLLGWEKLFNKCLVDLDKSNRISMHDHLRDLGREIANRQIPYRLWYRNQIIQVQPQQVGIQIRGMVANATRVNWYSQRKVEINTSQGVRSLTPSSVGLKILVCMGNKNQGNGDLPRGLIWLCDYNFLHRKLPWFSLQSLRILLLNGARNLENLWDTDADAPLQLRELTIQGCQNFHGFPESIGNLKHLKEIRLNPKSSAMTSLPNQFCFLQSLEHLQLSRCENLSSLPRNFGNLTNLRHLDFSYCSQLMTLSDSFKQLTLLEYLNLEGCRELSFKTENLDILEQMRKLEYLNLNECRNLETFPLPNGASLTELHLKDTRLRELPDKIGQLRKLPVLEINSELLKSLPTSIGNLSALTALKISSCPNLESLPTSLWDLPTLTELEIMSTKVSKISIPEACCPRLLSLSLRYNHLLREIETLPRTMETIKVDHCDVLQSIRGICHLEKLQTMSFLNVQTWMGFRALLNYFH